jgi:type VI secretion system protein ImpC
MVRNAQDTNTSQPGQGWASRVSEFITQTTLPPGEQDRVRTAMALVLPPNLVEPADHTLTETDAVCDLIATNAPALMNEVLSGIMHSEPYQKALMNWVTIEGLVEHPEVGTDVQVYYVAATKQDLITDFAASGWNAEDTDVYRMVVRENLKSVNGDPVLAVGLNFAFGPGPADVRLMDGLARAGEAGLVTFLAPVTPQFFGVESFDRVPLKKSLLTGTLKRNELADYQDFRTRSHARYFALVAPDVAVCEPFDAVNNPCPGLPDFTEVVRSGQDVVRCGAHLAVLRNIARSMTVYNWPTAICGLDYGGTIDGLVLREFAAEDGSFQVAPVEVPIDDDVEMIIQNLTGVIPVRPIKNKNKAVVFEAVSLKKALVGLNPELNNAAKLATKLPVVLVEARFGHYLRETFLHLIGSHKDPKVVKVHLQAWANTYVLNSDGPVPEATRAERPFRAIDIEVIECPDEPGRLQVDATLTPAFRVAAVTARLIIKAPRDEAGGD